MKYIFLSLLLSVVTLISFAQSPTFEQDAAKVETAIKSRSAQIGYHLVIKYNSTNNASFYIVPNKTYLIYYVYDIEPRVAVDFKAYVMSSNKDLEKKYTAIPEDVVVEGSAKVAALRFSTEILKEKKAPVKIEASPKAKIYIYEK